MPQKQFAEWFTSYIPLYHRTMNELMNEKELAAEEQRGEKRKADAMVDSDSKESSEASEDSSDDEGESEVVYRTVKCPHCKRWAWKVFKFTFKLTILVIAQLISNYLLCNQ